ncbi:MAG TPA: polysaccharide deacetylase family protein [Bacteroidales bacterium]|nr:polysaccharide deacetylase family protein [Bacteroidales bacterium]
MEARPVKIYTTEDVPRLQYIAGLVLGDILGLSWEVITDKRKLGKYTIINYSEEDIPGSFKINPNSLLFEKGIQPQEILVDEWEGLPIFFSSSPDSDIPFDVFAASFFLVSRYEEYLEFQPDQFGRFQASSSVAFKNGFLEMPIVDLWVKELARALLNKFHYLAFKRNQYRALLTVDIDQPFAYLGKSLIRSIGGLFRDIKSNSESINERYRTIAKGEKDPYETFDYIIENIDKENVDVRFFLPVGDHTEYDKNPSWRNDKYRKLIHRIADKFETGLHPSFFAAISSEMISGESVRLRTILKREILLSRFHYIRLFIPQSYNDIINAGIMEDYSMGYPDEPGFRAGIARPFYFYDVSKDQQTSLKIIPFQVMDGTLYNYKNLDSIASREVIIRMINEIRKVGGLFVSIWHNTSLLDNQEWQGWRDLFEFMLKNQKP